MNSTIDFKTFEEWDHEKIMATSYDNLPRKFTPKTVNFCPYCRALVGATLTAPFVYLWRLFPHKEKPPMTIEQIRKASRRRLWIGVGIGSGINIALGISKLITLDFSMENIIAVSIPIGGGVALLTGVRWGPHLVKLIVKLSALVPKRTKTKKIEKPKKPSKFMENLHKKHEAICPPIYFIEPRDTQSLK